MKIKKKLGNILLDLGIISDADMQRCLEIQKTSDYKLGEILLHEKYVTREQMAAVLEYQYNIPFVELSSYPIDEKAPKIISEALARQHTVIPVAQKNGKLVIVMEDPFDIIARDDIKLITGYDLEILMSFKADILKLIDQYYDASEAVESAFEEMQETEVVIEEEEENEEIASSPIVRVVNSIIRRAIKTRASDIHIEPFEDLVRVRYRIDGALKVEMNTPKSSLNGMVTRIKILGGMDISEKRIPQDGRIETEVDGKKVDLRVSILPTVHGEKTVIRILHRTSILMTKEKIGFTKHNIALFEKIIKAPEGIILLTGPTGSGKTTTLYAVLGELNKINTNIITAEDPVEYRLEGVNQVQINVKSGLDFPATLRSILRQDPDVIMVGEIRDSETVEMAVRASITGHIVLSTLHTNDTVSTISRLEDMGIEPFMVSTAVVGIIAQRLVKRICENCKGIVVVTDDEESILKVAKGTKICKGKGCNACGNSGYFGRIAIHEVLVLNKELKSMISKSEPIEDIKDAAVKFGMETLSESCRKLVLEGVTTVEEMLRVTYSIDE